MVSDGLGDYVDVELGECICIGSYDCAGDCDGDAEYDECGECNGDGIDEGACDCAGNVEDCAGDCGGSTVVDECGECGGPGPDAGFDCDGACVDAAICGLADVTVTATQTGATVSYESNFDVGGFQFTASGVSLTGATSDLLGTQFNSSTGIVLGFDFSGGTLPSGSGVLVELTFDEVAGGSILDLSGITVSSASGVTLASNGDASADVPACDDVDADGVCDSGDEIGRASCRERV